MMLSSSPSGPDSLACTCSVGSDSASVAADSASSALAPACVRASARPASERSHSSCTVRMFLRLSFLATSASTPGSCISAASDTSLGLPEAGLRMEIGTACDTHCIISTTASDGVIQPKPCGARGSAAAILSISSSSTGAFPSTNLRSGCSFSGMSCSRSRCAISSRWHLSTGALRRQNRGLSLSSGLLRLTSLPSSSMGAACSDGVLSVMNSIAHTSVSGTRTSDCDSLTAYLECT
mmetsp:Transcript_30909/g.91947  ORF Transcript_30909/g.91947 Transcript_30909/m.91947 type:complete len:237 (+) Transcript_30909:1018-1728(+)